VCACAVVRVCVCGDWCTDDHAGHGLAAQVEQALDVEEVGGLRCTP
jgi:hypothetical protein